MEPARELALATITDELAGARLDIADLVTVATGILSRVKPGTWLAMVMNDDPSTSRIVTVDDSDPAMARYIDAYVSSLDRPGRAPTVGISRRVIESGAPYLVPSMPFEGLFSITTDAARPYMDEHPLPRAIETVGIVVVPMVARDVTIGSLALIDWDCRLQLGDEDVRWMQAVGDRLAASIEHVQCHSAAIDRLERLNAIRNVGLALASSEDPRLTMQIILEQVAARLRVSAADILLVDETAHELYPTASVGFRSGTTPAFRLPIGPEMMELPRFGLGRDARPQADLARRLRNRPGFAREGFQFYHAVPLYSRGRLVGVLEVFDRSENEPDREWLGFMESVGSMAAIAIDNITMDSELRRAGAPSGRAAQAARPKLSEVEWRIVGLVVDGATNREIAAKLHLSESAIKFHVRRIFDTVGAANRTELAGKATQQGWF